MHHQYADGSQIYVSATKNELSVKAEILERCTADVHAWLLHNGLQLNPQKSDVIQFTVGRGRERTDDLDTILISDAICQTSVLDKISSNLIKEHDMAINVDLF
jgi:hypothetical protein